MLAFVAGHTDGNAWITTGVELNDRNRAAIDVQRRGAPGVVTVANDDATVVWAAIEVDSVGGRSAQESERGVSSVVADVPANVVGGAKGRSTISAPRTGAAAIGGTDTLEYSVCVRLPGKRRQDGNGQDANHGCRPLRDYGSFQIH